MLGGVATGVAVAIYINKKNDESILKNNENIVNNEIDLKKLPQGSSEFSYPNGKLIITRKNDHYDYNIVSSGGNQRLSGISGSGMYVRNNNIEFVAKDDKLTVRKI
jgi:hypothetical protein